MATLVEKIDIIAHKSGFAMNRLSANDIATSLMC